MAKGAKRTDSKFAQAKAMRKRNMTYDAIGRALDVSATTIYNWLNGRRREENPKPVSRCHRCRGSKPREQIGYCTFCKDELGLTEPVAKPEPQPNTPAANRSRVVRMRAAPSTKPPGGYRGKRKVEPVATGRSYA